MKALFLVGHPTRGCLPPLEKSDTSRCEYGDQDRDFTRENALKGCSWNGGDDHRRNEHRDGDVDDAHPEHGVNRSAAQPVRISPHRLAPSPLLAVLRRQGIVRISAREEPLSEFGDDGLEDASGRGSRKVPAINLVSQFIHEVCENSEEVPPREKQRPPREHHRHRSERTQPRGSKQEVRDFDEACDVDGEARSHQEKRSQEHEERECGALPEVPRPDEVTDVVSAVRESFPATGVQESIGHDALGRDRDRLQETRLRPMNADRGEHASTSIEHALDLVLKVVEVVAIGRLQDVLVRFLSLARQRPFGSIHGGRVPTLLVQARHDLGHVLKLVQCRHLGFELGLGHVRNRKRHLFEAQRSVPDLVHESPPAARSDPPVPSLVAQVDQVVHDDEEPQLTRPQERSLDHRPVLDRHRFFEESGELVDRELALFGLRFGDGVDESDDRTTAEHSYALHPVGCHGSKYSVLRSSDSRDQALEEKRDPVDEERDVFERDLFDGVGDPVIDLLNRRGTEVACNLFCTLAVLLCGGTDAGLGKEIEGF